MSDPFLSIIIPTYNRADHILRTIHSIISQSFNDIELIIVDDGSTDNTAEIVQSIADARIHYFRISNSERGKARNMGLVKAKATYVNFFDSDDLFLPCLESLFDFAKKENGPPVIYGDIQHVDERGNAIKLRGPNFSSFTKNLLYTNFLACGSVFLKREIAEKFPFDEDRRLSSAEDWELWLRLHSQYKFTYFNQFIFQQVHHADRSLRNITAERIEQRDSYFASLINHDETQKKVYGSQAIDLFMADRYTFIALAWSGEDRRKGFRFLIKSIQATTKILVRKRFWAVFRILIYLN